MSAADRPDVVPLWRPTGPDEWEHVAASGYRAWPSRGAEQPAFLAVSDERRATTIAREVVVAHERAAYVTRFDVEAQWLSGVPAREQGVQEYEIPAGRLPELNEHLVGAIQEMARYVGPAAPEAVVAFETWATARGGPVPADWLTYLQGPSRLAAGWLASGIYVTLLGPEVSMGLTDLWTEGRDTHPGVVLIGGDGAAEHLVLDLRDADPAVYLLPNVSSGWSDRIQQAASVAELVAQIEAGTFEISFGGSPTDGTASVTELGVAGRPRQTSQGE